MSVHTMPHSDDFGIDEDESLFFAAATQLESCQHHGFEVSLRPTKRRRVRRKGPPQIDGAESQDMEWSETDDESQSPPKISTCPQSNAASTQADAPQHGSDEPGEDYLSFPGELTVEENTSKRSKYRIHVPEKGRKFPDMVFTQTQHGLDDDPTKFRGAIWKRPPPRIQQTVGGIANANGFTKSVAPRPLVKNIGSYFQAQGGAQPGEEDDATLAARLQAEEDAISRQRGDENRPPYDMTQDLDDLPSDAFSSSSPEKSPRRNVIDVSSQPAQTHYQRPAGLRGPQTGLKQLTIFGQPAIQDLTASQQASKRHAWPLAAREEAATHHKLDPEAMKSWVYPTNLGTTRDYQYNIVSRSLFHNTLVALPTGLGKTFIAATVMLNYYRWTMNAQIVFMAPTKPLIAQQMEACYGIVGIPKRDTVLMTGETTPAVRSDEWREKRVFFMTPQTVINDLKTGICDPKKLILLVVDEAHKATGGYAYTEVIAFMRRFNGSFRVLALTATPGSTVEAVQAVIDNLGIARVELRTEQSLDIRQYTHEKQTETEIFEFSPEQGRIMQLFAKALQPSVDKLSSQNAYWSKDPMKLTAYGLTTARQKWMQSDTGRKAPQPVKGMMNAAFTVLSSLAHSIGLLKFHGIGPFYSGVIAFQKEVESGQTKSKTATGIAHSDHFSTMMSTMRTWTNDPTFIGHPKLEYVREVVLNHFLDAGEGMQGSDVPPSETRVMIFASYRDSVEEIVRVLKRNEPMIRPHVFVGQAASKGSEGMDQKKQNAVIQDFKSGKFNTLVATSIGEEGLDIGDVDLIVCYDASSSPIRMLQRIGRTGRKRVGRVVLLLMKEKEESDYAKAQDNYAYIQKSIADAAKYAYRDDQSPRILPKEVKPVCDKRPVEIPIENSQPVDLNERGRRAKGGRKAKRLPKKFHMPDNVQTGFVTASKLDSDIDEPGKGFVAPKKTVVRKKSISAEKRTASPSAESETAPLPSLPNVFLDDKQLQELQEKYAQTAAVDGDGIIALPNALRFPAKYGNLGPTKQIRHGRTAQTVECAMQAIHGVDAESVSRMEAALHMSDLEDTGPARVRLISPQVQRPAVARIAPGRLTGISLLAPVALPVPGPKPRGRPKKAPPPPPKPVDSESEPELPCPPPPAPRRIQTTKPRGRPRKKQPLQRTVSYGSAAGEGAESSPEPTPADMRLGTQGIELGSRDTSGEDDEEEPDSDDLAFMAHTSDPIEMASSSQPGTPAARKRRGLRKKQNPFARVADLSDVEELDGSDKVSAIDVAQDDRPVAKVGRRKRVLADSDSDE